MTEPASFSERMNRLYHAAMKDGSLAAVFREAIKDLRSTVMEVFLSSGEHGSEPGTPYNPLFRDLLDAREHHVSQLESQPMESQQISPSQLLDGMDAKSQTGQEQTNALGDTGLQASPSQIADNPNAYSPQENGHEQAMTHEQEHDHSRGM